MGAPARKSLPESAPQPVLNVAKPIAVKKFLGRMYVAWLAIWGLFRCWARYVWTGQNPKETFHHLVNAFCRTHGVSNEIFHAGFQIFRPKRRLASHSGYLGDIEGSKKKHVLSLLRRDGYFVFPGVLHPKVVDALVAAANTLKAAPTPTPKNCPTYIHFSEHTKYGWAPTYRFDEQDLMTVPEIQNICADYSFMTIAQEYLGCQPVLDIIAMWWSVAGNGNPSEEAAQLYHFDMDRTRWLKFIVYLTDVTPETGPHAFVRGSHRPFTKPAGLLRHNYARISDQEMSMYYDSSRFEEFCAPKGTVLAVDTMGFHKGTALKKDNRLVFELEFTNSLFGVPYTKTPVQTTAHSPLATRVAEHPAYYKKFDIKKGS